MAWHVWHNFWGVDSLFALYRVRRMDLKLSLIVQRVHTKKDT